MVEVIRDLLIDECGATYLIYILFLQVVLGRMILRVLRELVLVDTGFIYALVHERGRAARYAVVLGMLPGHEV
jgi:hypothetical protein